MTDALAMLVPVLGRALLHFLWQGAVIGLAAALALQALRNARPQARYAVACLALLACALAPIVDMVGTACGSGTDARALQHGDALHCAPMVATAATAARRLGRLAGRRCVALDRCPVGRGRMRAVAAHGDGRGLDPAPARYAARRQRRPRGRRDWTGWPSASDLRRPIALRLVDSLDSARRRRAGGGRWCCCRRIADAHAGRTDRGAARARTGAHPSPRLPGEPVAGRSGGACCSTTRSRGGCRGRSASSASTSPTSSRSR